MPIYHNVIIILITGTVYMYYCTICLTLVLIMVHIISVNYTFIYNHSVRNVHCIHTEQYSTVHTISDNRGIQINNN